MENGFLMGKVNLRKLMKKILEVKWSLIGGVCFNNERDKPTSEGRCTVLSNMRRTVVIIDSGVFGFTSTVINNIKEVRLNFILIRLFFISAVFYEEESAGKPFSNNPWKDHQQHLFCPRTILSKWCNNFFLHSRVRRRFLMRIIENKERNKQRWWFDLLVNWYLLCIQTLSLLFFFL